jgi:hypothetical protein
MSTPHDGNNKIILERIALTNSRDTIPIRPATNHVLRPQDTIRANHKAALQTLFNTVLHLLMRGGV